MDEIFCKGIKMKKQYNLPPYTKEELNARIDEAEKQIARGEVISAEEADLELERFFTTLK